jgi:superfamily II DNA/RNA helicase
LVLDEFDALLEYKAHSEPTRAIVNALKRRHGDALQSVLCSATALDIVDSANIRSLLRPGYAQALADPDDVLVTNMQQSGSGGGSSNNQRASTTARVSRTVMHGVVHVPHKKLALETVRKILHTEPTLQQILIFADTPRKVDIVVEKLGQMGILAAALHGGMGSEKMDRAEVSKALRDGYVGIVVATEMAARGLDAPLLTHVINLDLPTDTSHYAHRAGRCGRGGRPGVVINITTSPEERKVPQRFAQALGIDMFTVEPRAGQLVVVDPSTQTIA